MSLTTRWREALSVSFQDEIFHIEEFWKTGGNSGNGIAKQIINRIIIKNFILSYRIVCVVYRPNYWFFFVREKSTSIILLSTTVDLIIFFFNFSSSNVDLQFFMIMEINIVMKIGQTLTKLFGNWTMKSIKLRLNRCEVKKEICKMSILSIFSVDKKWMVIFLQINQLQPEHSFFCFVCIFDRFNWWKIISVSTNVSQLTGPFVTWHWSC